MNNGWCRVYTYSDIDKHTKAEWARVSQKYVLVRHICSSDHEVLSQQTRCSCDGSDDMMYSALHTSIINIDQCSDIEFEFNRVDMSAS